MTKRYGCTGCSEKFDTFEEALPHHDQITGHNICTPPISPCPQCTRFREKMDREKFIIKVRDETRGTNWTYHSLTDALIKYLAE